MKKTVKKVAKKSKPITKSELKPAVVVKDNFECAGPVNDTVTDVYVEDIKKGGFESFSYQRRAEDFVEEHVEPTPKAFSYWWLVLAIVFFLIAINY